MGHKINLKIRIHHLKPRIPAIQKEPVQTLRLKKRRDQASNGHFLFLFYFIFREKVREREREKKINQLPPVHPLLGIKPATQARALTGN